MNPGKSSPKKGLLYFFLLIFLASCGDCVTVIEGRIISGRTKLPISNATVELIDKNTLVKSDENGQFKIEYVSSFCFDPEVRVSSKNHKPFQIKIHSTGNTKSYELRSKTKFIDYEKPFYPNPEKEDTFMNGAWINNFSQNFSVYNDSLLIYLDDNNITKELENIRKH